MESVGVRGRLEEREKEREREGGRERDTVEGQRGKVFYFFFFD